MSRLFISFSGGETSAFMAQWLLWNRAEYYDQVVCLFANTGQENEETLRFVERCDEKFSLGVVWIEADVQHKKQVGTKHRMVNYETASRNGEPFREVIKKYGIPNPAYPHCTRELKTSAMTSYLRSIGWERGTYDTAIGIRADEIDRIDAKHRELRYIYPLVSDVKMTKPAINDWWRNQSFRLELKGYEGNCKWCWKKSLRKHLTLMSEHPEWYDFPQEMEEKHGLSGYNEDGTRRTFFRGNRSVKDLKALAAQGGFIPAWDDSEVYTDQIDLDLDASYGCSESCEVDFADAE